jgi:putative ABC transport system permease protein
MSFWRAARSGLRSLFSRERVEQELDDELRHYLAMATQENVRRGMSPEAAERAARLQMGGLEATKAHVRWGGWEGSVEWLRQDLRVAARVMRSNPTITAAIVLTLALGIGATTAIFSVVHTVLLRPLPFADSERILRISETLNGSDGPASVGHYHDWAEQAPSLAAISASRGQTFNLTDAEPVRVAGGRVTPSYFQVLHMRPALGRYFRPDETMESRVAVLSHPFWQSQFSGDSSILGKEITLNGERHTVVGVTPKEFTLTDLTPSVFAPLSFTPAERADYGDHMFITFARLKPDATIDQARREIEAVTEDILRRHPAMKGRGVVLQRFDRLLVRNFRTQLWVLLGAVTFVLLIGCANVASLLLARAAARRKEIAIRGALGAARSRLVRQLLTESLLLAFVGGLAGLALAHFGIRFLVSMGPPRVPRLMHVALDPVVLSFAAAITLLCGLLFGLAPALRATRVDLQTELREGGRGAGGVVRDRVRAGLVVTEIAVALVLLVSAGLLIRSALQLQSVTPGFDPTGVTMMRIALPADRYAELPAIEQAFLRIVEQVRAIPRVERAAAGSRVPMSAGNMEMGITVDGRAPNPDRAEVGAIRLVTDGYLETLGMTIKQGRTLTDADMRAGAPWVIVVNEAFARSIFGDENPLGKRISGWTSMPESEPEWRPEWREIVGVVGDVRSFGLEVDVPPEMYIPLTQPPGGRTGGGAWNAFQRSVAIIARARPGTVVAPAMRNAVRSVDRMLPVFDLQTMDDVLQQSTEARRFNTLLLSGLGLTGLILAAIGIYGVVAFFVSQRTHEIGVRVALGATGRDVMSMVVREALTLASVGVAVGGVAAYWATQTLRSMLYEVDARDPVAYVAAAVVLVLVAVLASTLPAGRAARIDPVRALASG